MLGNGKFKKCTGKELCITHNKSCWLLAFLSMTKFVQLNAELFFKVELTT